MTGVQTCALPILSNLTQNYGSAVSTEHGWYFRKDYEYANFTIDPKGSCDLYMGTDKYIHTVENFYKKEKLTFITTKGHLFNYNGRGLANGKDTSDFDSFYINFIGIKETKIITLYFTTEHKDIKEISLLMDGGNVVVIKPDKKRRGKPYYFYKFNLSHDTADKLYQQKYRAISFKGRYPNTVEIPNDSSTDFELIYKYLYLN